MAAPDLPPTMVGRLARRLFGNSSADRRGPEKDAATTAPASGNDPVAPLLQLRGVEAGYGRSRVLQGVDLELHRGEIVSLLGRNGSGRSTLLKAAMGLVPADGDIVIGGRSLAGMAPFQRARLGMGYVPEGREVFARLSVAQNLELGRKSRGEEAAVRWTVDDMYALFPALAARRTTPAGVLSGGEQQMLTLCRTLMGSPSLMLIDEPTEGLAPAVVERVAAFLLEVSRRGLAVLLVEQKLAIALTVSQRCCVMGRGRIVWSGTPAALADAPRVRREWLEV